MLARLPWLPVLGYGSFFFFAFLLFAYWTFPYERVARHFAQHLAASEGYRITVEDVAPYWWTGVEIENAHIYSGPDDEQGIHVIDGRARASLFTVLGSAQDISFAFDLATGSLEGTYSREEDVLTVKAKLENVQLQMFPMLADAAGLPLAGAATGEIDLSLFDEPDKSTGFVDLTVKKFRLGDGVAKLSIPGVPALTVDPIDAGDLKIDLKVSDGVAALNELSAAGDDLELTGEGDVQLGKSLGTSRANVALRAKVTDAYKTKTPRTEAMFSLLEGSNSRQIKQALGEDGWFSFQLTGSLSQPRFLPGARAGAAPRRSPTRSRARRRAGH